jgi:hypothetical protein
MKQPKLLLLTNRPLNSAPRVIRELNFLKDYYQIIAYGSTAPITTHSSIVFNNINWLKKSFIVRVINYLFTKLPIRNYFVFDFTYYNQLVKVIASNKPDLVLVHEPQFLPYMLKLKKKYEFKLIFNAHEYYPLEFDDNPQWIKKWQRYYINIYKKYLIAVDLMINVCDGIRLKCIEDFNKSSIVIPNAGTYNNCAPSITQPIIKIIHHGALIPERKIEIMADAVGELGSNYQLYFMLMDTNTAYKTTFEQYIKQYNNVHIIPTVPFNEIVTTINKYDIGLFLLPPNNFNYKVALPNKLFEYIQAKLMVVIGPSIEMAKIVSQYNIGLVALQFDKQALIDVLKTCDATIIDKYKNNCITAAKQLNAETYNELLLAEINNLLK